MALLKEITNEIGQTTSYHRISRVEIDFDINQINIYIKSYANKNYRITEKEEEQNIKIQINRYYELQSLIGKTSVEDVLDSNGNKIDIKYIDIITDEEKNEFDSMNIQELESKKIIDKSAKTTLYTINIESLEDWRTKIYETIKNQIIDFKDAITEEDI